MATYKLDLNRKTLNEDKPTGATVQGKKIAVVLHKGKVYALNAICTHRGGQLDKGRVQGDEIICPLHGGKYFMATGKADESTNWVHDTETYKISEGKDGELSVEM